MYLPDLSFEAKAAIREAILRGDRLAVSYSVSQCPHPANLDLYCWQLDSLLEGRGKTTRAFWLKSASGITADVKGKVGIIFYAEDLSEYAVEGDPFEVDDESDESFADTEGSPPLPFDYSPDIESIVITR